MKKALKTSLKIVSLLFLVLGGVAAGKYIDYRIKQENSMSQYSSQLAEMELAKKDYNLAMTSFLESTIGKDVYYTPFYNITAKNQKNYLNTFFVNAELFKEDGNDLTYTEIKSKYANKEPIDIKLLSLELNDEEYNFFNETNSYFNYDKSDTFKYDRYKAFSLDENEKEAQGTLVWHNHYNTCHGPVTGYDGLNFYKKFIPLINSCSTNQDKYSFNNYSFSILFVKEISY